MEISIKTGIAMAHNPAAQFVFLIGMPAAGKTYWGERLAKKYKLPFIDTDSFIAEQEAASISALFASYGENGFREREQKSLKKIIATTKTSAIISCGGGTPCYNDNIQLMKAAGTVIYLDVDIPALLAHIHSSTDVRPLLNNKPDLAAHLADLLKKRKPYYEQAHHILHTKDISLTTFAKILAYV